MKPSYQVYFHIKTWLCLRTVFFNGWINRKLRKNEKMNRGWLGWTRDKFFQDFLELSRIATWIENYCKMTQSLMNKYTLEDYIKIIWIILLELKVSWLIGSLALNRNERRLRWRAKTIGAMVILIMRRKNLRTIQIFNHMFHSS